MSQVKRVKGVSVARPIVYGNVAMPITGKKPADPDHTHKWTISVRGAGNEDVSTFIKKVQFKLHETYTSPLRTVENPPFEVTETGWGEFEIAIKVFFHPLSGEKSASLYHHLRLHPYEDDGTGQPWPKTKPVTSYQYDEIVFNEPTEAFYQHLVENNAINNPIPSKKSSREGAHPFSLQLEQEELDRIITAQKEVDEQIEEMKARIASADDELAQLKKEGYV